jgi:hypothetical protein
VAERLTEDTPAMEIGNATRPYCGMRSSFARNSWSASYRTTFAKSLLALGTKKSGDTCNLECAPLKQCFFPVPVA